MARLKNRKRLRLFRTPIYRRRWFVRLALWGGVACLAGVMAVIIFLRPYYLQAQEFDLAVIGDVPLASIMYDRNGVAIGRIYEEKNIELVSYSDFPQHLIYALMAAEDRRFLQHSGVDYIGIIRAARRNLRADSGTHGASTITQQLARNAYGLRDRTIERKLVEAFLANRIENKFTKPAILELYLNRIFFGPGAYGIHAASRRYFSKHPRDLTIEESATLCALIKSPVRLSPLRNPEASLLHRNYLLDRMHSEGFLTATQVRELKAKPLVTNPDSTITNYPYVYEEVRMRLLEELEPEQLSRGGLQIYTTLDIGLQKKAERSLKQRLEDLEGQADYPNQTFERFVELEKRSRILEQDPPSRDYIQGAVLAIDNRTGGILAMVGGRDYAYNKFNSALWARRAAGTGFLPFVYAAAFEEGDFPGTRVLDEPIDNNLVMIGGLVGILGEWGVEAPHFHEGKVTARRALQMSYLGASFRLGDRIGRGKVLDVARRAGLSFTSERERMPSTILGQSELTLGEYSRAYAAFANGGKRPRELHLVTRVLDRHGEEILRIEPDEGDSVEVVDPVTAYQVHSILTDVLKVGTGRKARDYGLVENVELAGKTSTSYNFTDNWFIGYSSEVTVGAWAGFDRPRPIYQGAFSKDTVLPIWVDVMNAAVESEGARSIAPPATAQRMEICTVSGMRATEFCYRHAPASGDEPPRMVRTTYVEYIRPGTAIEDYCDIHQRGGVSLAGSLRGLESSGNFPGVGGQRAAESMVRPQGPYIIGDDPYQAMVPQVADAGDGEEDRLPTIRQAVIVGPESSPSLLRPREEPVGLERPGRIEFDDF